jgi:hypothetical protein
MLVSFVCLRFNWLFQISILLFFFFSLLFYISHFFSLCRVCYLLFLLYISSDSFNGLLPVESVINNNIFIMDAQGLRKSFSIRGIRLVQRHQ